MALIMWSDDYSVGILDGVRGMEAMARGLNLPKPKTPWWFLPLVILGAIAIVALIVNLFRTGRKGWAWVVIAAPARGPVPCTTLSTPGGSPASAARSMIR